MTFDRKSARLVALTLALTVVSLFLATRIEIDNQLQHWIAFEAEDELRYSQFLATFGPDEFVLVAIAGPELFGADSLESQLDVVTTVEKLPHVERVFGPPTIYRDLFGAEDPEALRQELFETDFYRRLIVSEDGQTAGLFIVIDPPDGALARRALLADIDDALDPLRTASFELHVVGPQILTAELDSASLAETRRSLPIAAAASILLLVLLLRSVRAMLVSCACSAVTIALVLGVMGLLQRPLNMFTSALPPILWVLSLAAILHIQVRYRLELEKRPHHDALRHAVARARFPCVLSSATTAAGFFSLNFTPMNAVREFGSLAGLGILLSLAVSYFLGPALIELLRPAPEKYGVRMPGLARCAGNAFERPLWAIAPFFLLTLGGLLGFSAIKLNANPLSFLPPESAVLADYRYVARDLSGLSALEIVLPTPDGWTQPDVWTKVAEIERRLLYNPAVAKVRSPLSILKKLHQWDVDLDPEEYRLPASHEGAETLLDNPDPAFLPELRSLVAADGRSIRLSALVTSMDSDRFSKVAELAGRLAEERFGSGAWVTGIVPLLVRGTTKLVGSQLRSLSLAALVVFGVILLGQRSFHWAIIVMVPNLAPVAAVFVVMAVFGLPLDPGTIMVAGVALGIAVDNTVHVATSLRRHHGDLPTRSAVEAAVAAVGGALTVTAMTATVGFASLAVAQFLPIRYFGILSACAIVVALAASLVFLPALLSLRYRWHMAGKHTDGASQP